MTDVYVLRLLFYVITFTSLRIRKSKFRSSCERNMKDGRSGNLIRLTEFSFFAAVLEGVIDNGAGQNNGAEDGEVQRARYA
jgi:hypothetical protein